MSDEEHDPLGWHVISGTTFLNAMRRCERESADLVYAEMWANAVNEDVEREPLVRPAPAPALRLPERLLVEVLRGIDRAGERLDAWLTKITEAAR